MIIDYIGIFYRLQEALNFEIEDIEGVANRLDALKEDFEETMDKLREQLKDQPREDDRDSLYKIIRLLETKDNFKIFKENLIKATKLFESISPDKDLYPHLPDYTWFQKINAAYNKHARRGKDSLKPYQEKTRKLIREKLIFDEIDEALPIFRIDPEYLKKIEKLDYSTDDEIAELRMALGDHIRINLGSLKFYEPLSEKLERILKYKNPEQMKEDLRKLVEEINQKEAEIREKGLTKTEYNLLQSAENVLKAPEEELIPFTKELMKDLEPLLFEGWNLKADSYRRVQRAIYDKLHHSYKDWVENLKQLLTLRDEFIKWLERHPTRPTG